METIDAKSCWPLLSSWWHDSKGIRTINHFVPQTNSSTGSTTGLRSSYTGFSVDSKINPLSLRTNCAYCITNLKHFTTFTISHLGKIRTLKLRCIFEACWKLYFLDVNLSFKQMSQLEQFIMKCYISLEEKKIEQITFM